MTVEYWRIFFALFLWESHVFAVWLGQAISIKRAPYMALIASESKQPGIIQYANGAILSSTLVLTHALFLE